MNLGFSYDARRVRGLAALVGVVLVFGLAAGAAGDLPKDRPARNGGGGLAPSTVALATRMTVNRVIMALTDAAEIGAIPGSVAGGGFWRALTDQYIFSSGVNVGATVDKPGGGLDTLVMIGGPFSELSAGSLVDFQTRAGTTRPGSDLGLFWVSTDPADFANFPLVCTVDEFRVSLFPSLAPFLGQPFPGFADQTICIAANDVGGAPCSACGGTRLGAETINTYFAFSIPAVQDFFFAILRVFNRSEFVTPTNSPANSVFGPYDFNDTVVAIAIDPDLGDAGDDQIGFLPGINTMVWWDSDFDEPDFQFQPPGFGGVSYLKTPEVEGEEVGLANFTVFTNGGARPDPSSRQEWYQGMTGDPNFVVFDVSPQDVRGMASSGQFPLPAGEFVEIYAAYFFAEAFGPTPTELTTNTAIIDGEPATALFNNFVAAQAGVQGVFDAGFLVPTAPPSPTVELIPGDQQVTIVWDNAPVLGVDPFARVALDPFQRDETGNPDPDAPGLGIFLEAEQIIFVPALDVPGTTQGFVTAAEAGLTGAELTNLFFDPDFVIQDFEGFRVYRSFEGTLDDAELIAQFDLANAIVEGDFCVEGTTVPAALEPGEEPLAVICTETEFFPIGTNTGLAFGIVDRGGVFPNPADGPGLINGIPVFYAVTSFSVNCGVLPVAGLPEEFIPLIDPDHDPAIPDPACLTLESGKNLQSATPRSNSTAFNAGATEQNVLTPLQGDGSDCDPTEPAATIDPATGDYVDFIDCSNAIVETNFLPLRPLNLPESAERFFVIDSITYPEYPFAVGTGGGLVWYHWETETGALANDMLPAVGNFRHNAAFAVLDQTVVTTGFRANPDDVGPDLQIAFTIVNDFGVMEDLEVNGQSLHKLELGGTHTGEHRPHAIAGSSLAANVRLGNARGVGTGREYSHPGPFATSAMSYELTWEVNGGQYTGVVRNLVTEEEIPLGGQPKGPDNPSTPGDFISGYNWGFIGPDAAATLRTRVTPASPLTNTMSLDVGDSFLLFLPGQSLLIEGITDLPESGDVWRILQDGGFQREEFGREPFDDPAATEWHYNDFNTADEPAFVNAFPGARWKVSFGSGGASNELADADLQQIRVVPNPFIAANEITRGLGRQRILFTNLPPQATIRIYTISGNLVRILEHGDGSGTTEWDVRTRFDLLVASGNYYYHVTTPDGRTHLGRFAVIN